MPANSDTTRPTLATAKADDGEGRQAQGELLADQRGQALAGVGAQAGRHLLHAPRADGDQHHEEQGAVAELRPRPRRRWRCRRRRCRRWPR